MNRTVAIVVSFGLVLLAMGAAVAASVIISLTLAHQSHQQICDGFGSFVHRPAAPVGSPLYRREKLNYDNLLKFDRKIGCHETP